jgi:hypothetical protein
VDVGVLFPLLPKVFIVFCSCPLKEFVGDPSIVDGLVEGSPGDVDLMCDISKKKPACTCTYYALICLTGTCKVFVRKFSTRSVSHVNILQWTYSQLICELVFLTEKSNLQPTLSHYKNLLDSL